MLQAMRSGPLLLVPLLVLASVLGGCTTNPATGEQSFTAFMSPDDELKVGAEEHPKILKQFGGRYEDRADALGRYVDQVGNRLARVSEMPGLSFRFTVLNDQAPNAFALPGGYVYITRGLLALVDTEAELAAVLAHEIGHVVARHPAQRYSHAQTANLGLTLLGVLGGAMGAPSGAGQILSMGAQGYIQGYSRDQEMEADRLSVRYLTRAGYAPRAAASMFTKLEAQTRLEAEISGNPEAAESFSFLSSHPRTRDRITQAVRLAEGPGSDAGQDGREEYLRQVEGLVFGDRPEEGIVRGREFLHPDFGIRFEVPPGFHLRNTPERVLAKGPKGATIIFDAYQGPGVKEVRDLKAFLVRQASEGIELSDSRSLDINGLEAATGAGRHKGKDVRFVLLQGRGDLIFRMVFITASQLTARLDEDLRRATWSFRRLDREERRTIRPLRLHVVRAGPGDTVADLAAAMPVEPFAERWLRVLNGLAPNEGLQPGRRLKVVR